MFTELIVQKIIIITWGAFASPPVLRVAVFDAVGWVCVKKIKNVYVLISRSPSLKMGKLIYLYISANLPNYPF